ncbi:MAG: hypothetical protein OXG78_05025 [Chloroflexi bacterium]|nr:hypothetical protein [Chloroflexota bacterium]
MSEFDETKSMTDLKQLIGASKAGRRFIAQMRYYNDGDFRKLRGFMRGGYYDLVLMENPVERRLLDLKAARRLHGRLKVAEVESAEDYAIRLILQAEKGGARLRLRLNVNESYPHQITHYSLRPLENED